MVPQPARPADGTYTYSLSQGGRQILSSTVAIKSNGATFDVSETCKLPNGQVATTATTWNSATLLPLRYEVRQGAVDLHATITGTTVTFDKALPTYTALAGTNYILVSEGLNALRMLLPYIVAAHPGESFTIAQIDGGGATRQAEPSTASPLPGGPSGDAVSVIAIESGPAEHITVWRNPTTGVVDEEQVSPGDVKMTLLHYTQL